MSQTVIETKDGWMIQCPACGWHEFPKTGKSGASWSFNGNLEKPTFSPSMNWSINQPNMQGYNPEIASRRCHFILTDGNISFCGDCTHALKGQNLPLVPWPEDRVKYYTALKETWGGK